LKNKKIILISGPTAVGKTAVAVNLARELNTSIISADSRQCFKELNIGVAKPSAEELQLVPHYFINSHSIHEEVNAALFEQLALQWAAEIFREKDILVMVGGTGLYIKAFCEGLDDIPPVPAETRELVQSSYEQEGIGWLQEQIGILDPEFQSAGETLNPQRLMRALEVKLSTGRSILSFRNRLKKQRPFEIRSIALQLPKEQLHRNINTRVDHMIQQGLLNEVNNLLPHRRLNALQTVGYTELFTYLDGKISFEEAVEAIKKNTRQYAKRQLTWFRKDHSIQWIEPDEWEKLKKIINS
jgi:tRNA dimethylallyltransferase